MSEIHQGKYHLVNVAEEVISEEVQRILPGEDMCRCEKCQLDVVALACNAIQPFYVTTEKGKAIISMFQLKIHRNIEVTTAIYRAIEKVKNKPMHDV